MPPFVTTIMTNFLKFDINEHLKNKYPKLTEEHIDLIASDVKQRWDYRELIDSVDFKCKQTAYYANIELGEGGFKYKVAVKWETVPPGYAWREVAAVAADSRDNVYVFNRGPHPMIVFDSDGNFLKSWGEDVFSRPHGVSVGPNDTLYCTDDGDHTVRQCTLDGKVLMTIGVPGQPAEYQSGQPFNRCTHVALDPKTGELYVSDGYGNSRIHKFTPDGTLLFSWGGPGTDPGEFNIPHTLSLIHI